MSCKQSLQALLVGGLVVLLGPALASARVLVATQTSTLTEPSFGSFTASKQADVYLEDDGVTFTYEYTIMNSMQSFDGLTRFILDLSQVPATCSIAVGFDALSGGIAPSNGGVIVGVPGDPMSQAVWDFMAPVILPGEDSKVLTIVSDCGPMDNIPDKVVSLVDQLELSAQGLCLGPSVLPMPPMGGEPLPCTIGFWKNRSEGKQGLLQFFPDADFDAVVDAAVALSGGVFADAAALITDLESKGNRPQDQRARQQLAAFLLNLAAGDLFPDNQKCKLFEANGVTANACETDVSVGDALQIALDDLAGGLFEDSKDCSDDVNNGIGIFDPSP
jgi:hypothetical protein